MTSHHTEVAIDLMGRAQVRERSELLLAAAQVHATLAVEQAVRDLIRVTSGAVSYEGLPQEEGR